MPKSFALPALLGLLGVFVFSIMNAGADVHPGRQEYIGVFITCFNFFALVTFLIILLASEKKDAAEFGKTIRENMTTVIVAVGINLVGSGYDAFVLFVR